MGAGNPDRSWAVLLARMLHWDAVVYGDPGTGYVRAGVERDGPVAAEIARIGLPALRPTLVIVQAGHNDIDADGWLDTRDLGHLDEDGYLFLAGRSDDVINRGGELPLGPTGKVARRRLRELALAR